MAIQSSELLTILDEHFDLDDLKDLCLNLDVDYENLGAATKKGKFRELILYFQRRQRVVELSDYLTRWLRENRMPNSVPNVRRIYQNLPCPSYYEFIGRQKEFEYIKQLLAPTSNCRIVSIDGIGGCGKTSLALEIAQYYLEKQDLILPKERFDAIIWATASTSLLTTEGVIPNWRGINTLEDIYTVIALTLDRKDILRVAREEQDEMIAQVLMRQRTLLIIDNLETMEDNRVFAFLEALPSPTKVIITTRSRFNTVYRVHLEPFSKQSGLELIASECKKRKINLSPEDIENLFVLTSGIPLAIVWSVAQIGSGFSVGTMLTLLKNARVEITEFCFGHAVDSIRSTDAYFLLLALAMFASDASRPMLADAAGLSGDAFRRDQGISKLLSLELADEDDQRLRILPLTKRFLSSELAQIPGFITEARARRVTSMIEFLKSHNPMQDTSPASKPFWEELDNARDLIRQSSSNKDWETLATLTASISPFFFVHGLWEELIKISDAGKEAARITFDWDSYAWVNIHLLMVFIERRDEENAGRAIADVEEAISKLDTVSDDLKEALGFRKAALAVMRDDADARELLEKEVLLSQKIGSKWREAGNLYYLGKWAYGKRLWEDAETYFQRALDIGESQKDYRSMALAYSYLPELVYRRGNYEDAYKLYLVGIEIAESYGEVISRARLILGMARLAKEMNSNEESQKYAVKALDLYLHLGIKDKVDECEQLVKGVQQ